MKKFLKFPFLILVSLYTPIHAHSNPLQTQGFTHGTFANCYQQYIIGHDDPLHPENNDNPNFLNLGGTVQFFFTSLQSYTLTTGYMRIEVQDAIGNWADITTVGLGQSLADTDYQWVTNTDGGETYPVIKIKNQNGSSYDINPNFFTLGNYKSVRLSTLGAINTTPTGSTKINLVNSVEEAFVMNPDDGANCYTFTPFSYNVNSILDNLCSPDIDIKFQLPSGSMNAGFFPPGWSVSKQLDNDGDGSDFFNTPNGTWCDQCIGVTAPYNAPNPVPCGCLNFEVVISIEPCNNAPTDCEPLEMSFQIEVCCSCDVRETPPND